MKSLLSKVGIVVLAVFAGGALADDISPSLELGAEVYKNRCVLCHGNQGMGEGILPLTIKDYPNTNLFEPRFPVDEASLRETIAYGGSKGRMSDEMPPWGDELTFQEMESVMQFTLLMHQNRDKAWARLASVREVQGTSLRAGKAIFKSRCTLCHGAEGKGDGKMARIIKDPPPFNLTLSRVPDDYLRQIIQKGGEAMGRSSRMPPWENELTSAQLDSVVSYVKSLRTD